MWTSESYPLEWASIQSNLGNLLRGLAECGAGVELFEKAAEAYEAALSFFRSVKADQQAAQITDQLRRIQSRIGTPPQLALSL